ncbi:MAG: DUF885 domain-containing protein [Gemmatimonadota bacterium]
MGQRWDEFVHAFVAETFAARPDVAVWAGAHEHDGGLPDWSPDGLEAEAARLRGLAQRARAFDAAALDGPRRFERAYAIARAEADLFWLDPARWPSRNPAWYAPSLDPNVYVTRPYAPPAERLRAFVRYAGSAVAAAAQIRGNLAGPLPATFREMAHTTFGGLADFYEEDVPRAFADVPDASLQQDLGRAAGEAAAAMRGLERDLASRPTAPDGAFALGEESFAAMLRVTEGVDVALDELERAGREELARNRADLEDACAELAPGESVAACVARVRGRKPAAGPVAEAAGQLEGLRRFVLEQDLVAVPGEERARVAESPPFMRWNSAYIDIPGPFEQGLPSVYYIAPPDPAWSADEREAYVPGVADLLFVTIHEVWPGHFLQFLHSNRSPSVLSRVFVGYAFSEGWAHYAEELMAEAGFGSDPESRIGRLVNALLRTVRYLAAIGLHARGMRVDQAERLFREQAFLDPANARQQAARGTFDPAYLNYTLGKLLIRRLRRDWTEPRGGRPAWREFHDRLLALGGPPLPLAREVLMGSASGALI